MFNGTDMSASRFESACGKGDAKKWKCSVHVEASPGVSGAVGPGNCGLCYGPAESFSRRCP